MKVVVFGAGMMGSVVIWDLAESSEVTEVVACDIDEELLQRIGASDPTGKVRVEVLDASDTAAISGILQGAFAAVSALAHEFSMGVLRVCVDAGVHLVDLVGSRPEERLALDGAARDNDALIIPGFGLAPGLTNVAIGRGFHLLDSVDTAVAKVGGLPSDPQPPLQYQVLYSMVSTFNQYVSDAVIVRDGEVVRVPAMSDLEIDEYPGPLGECESFVTDGLSTLPFILDLRGISYMAEKTVRYPGHADKITTLMECGLFDTEPVTVDETRVIPRHVLDVLLRPRLTTDDSRDISVMRAEIIGMRGGMRTGLRYQLVDFYDEDAAMTSMARTTAYPCATAVRMLIRGEIPERGVKGPEEIFVDHRYESLIDELARYGVRIEETMFEV